MTQTVAADLQQLAKARFGFGGAGLDSRPASCRGVWLAAPLPLVR